MFMDQIRHENSGTDDSKVIDVGLLSSEIMWTYE